MSDYSRRRAEEMARTANEAAQGMEDALASGNLARAVNVKAWGIARLRMLSAVEPSGLAEEATRVLALTRSVWLP